MDAVAVLTPHHLHLPYVRAAARAGRHVLVEKAIAHTVAAADELIEACRAHGVTLAGIFQNRFTPAARRLRDTVANGGLGRVFLASVTVNEYRAPSYFLDFPLAWPESRGRRRRAHDPGDPHDRPAPLGAGHAAAGPGAETHTVVHDVEVEDVAVGLLEFEGGVTGGAPGHDGRRCRSEPPSVEIQGDRGTASGERELGPSRVPAQHRRGPRPARTFARRARSDRARGRAVRGADRGLRGRRPARAGRPSSTVWKLARRSSWWTRCIARPATREWVTVDPVPSAAPRR